MEKKLTQLHEVDEDYTVSESLLRLKTGVL
jgi:hypothetical protein